MNVNLSKFKQNFWLWPLPCCFDVLAVLEFYYRQYYIYCQYYVCSQATISADDALLFRSYRTVFYYFTCAFIY